MLPLSVWFMATALAHGGVAAIGPVPLAEDNDLTLPNLAPLPPYDVFVGPSDQPQGPVWSSTDEVLGRTVKTPAALRFTTTIHNRGAYGFELAGAPSAPDPASPDLLTTQAYQCVKFVGPEINGAPRACKRYIPMGTLTWHAQHHHFHIDGFGRYELRRDLAGRPDMGARGLVAAADKTGWCVSDMYNWRDPYVPDEGGGASPTGNTFVDFIAEALLFDPVPAGWYGECSDPVLQSGASWRQGISPGWADTYPMLYAGQEIPLKGVPDGIYWIVTTINPKPNTAGLTIRETTWADNTSAAKVQIYAGGKKARLLAPMPAKPYDDWYDNPEDQPGH